MSEEGEADPCGSRDDCMVTDWGHLAHHLLDGVLAQMAEHEVVVLLRCGRRVNRHWCVWATQATTHLTITCKGNRRQGVGDRLKRTLTCFTAVECIVLKSTGGIELSPLQRAPFLKRLKIDALLTGRCMAQLGLLTALVELDLTHDIVFHDFSIVSDSLFCRTDSGMEALTSLTWLRRLALESRQGDECTAIIATLPALSDVRLNAHVSCVGIRHLATMPNLARCALVHQPKGVSAKGAEILGTMTKLVALCIYGHDDADGSGAAHLCSLTNLTELDIKNFPATDSGIHALTCLTAISRLCLRRHPKNTDEIWRSLQRFPALSALEMHNRGDAARGAPTISEDGIRWLGVLTGLVDLQLHSDGMRGFEPVYDSVAFFSNLTALTSLATRAFQNIDDTHAARLSSLVMLKQLDLSHCMHITNVGCLAALTRLTDLNLMNTGVKDSGFEKLTPMTSLTKLSLERCRLITDQAMEKLAELAALATLDLSCCGRITNVGVMHLRPLRFLRRLEVGGCEQVTISPETFLRKWVEM